jgi:murein DD-endopeptidase MepM/ murein hydrolase activator NlpD
MHRGTDFAAPTGTPILAAGEGTVLRAGPFSSFGNYVRIRHANGYETAYAHLSRFARGIRAGTRVRQGQIIGYVGTTGRSTGPHLHYEVLRRGQQINPINLRVANGRNLTDRALELFEIERQRIDTLRQVRASETPAQEAALRVTRGDGGR